MWQDRAVPVYSRQWQALQGEEKDVAKVVECNKVNAAPDCTFVIRAETEPDVIRLAQEHAATHGLPPSPQLAIKVKARIRDE
jgi:predicted small metal-binding protein